jgi:hypothetical protein
MTSPSPGAVSGTPDFGPHHRQHPNGNGRSSPVNLFCLAIPAWKPDFGDTMDELHQIPPEPLTAEEDLAPPGSPVSLTIVPGVLDQPLFAIREDGDTDEDFEASKRLVAAILDLTKRG